MRILVVGLACVAVSGCTASRVATAPVPTAACVGEGEVAQAPVDEATRNYQTAYSVCHSDPAFAASLYQQVVDHADPQSDLYSRASGRLDALQSALADRMHPEAARQACDQAANWARPTERIAVEASNEVPAARVPMAPVAVAATEAGPLPASWLPAPPANRPGDAATQSALRGSVRGGCPSDSAGVGATSWQASAGAGGSAGGACGCAAPSATAVGAVAGSAGVSCTATQLGASAGAEVTAATGCGSGLCGTGNLAGEAVVSSPGADVIGSSACASGSCGPSSLVGSALSVTPGCSGAVAGEWAPFEPRAPSATGAVVAAEPEFVAPPLVAVAEAPLPAPPLVVAPAPVLSAPPMVVGVGYARPTYIPSRVRVVVPRRDPGAEFLGALFNVFGTQPVRVYPQRTQQRPH